MDSEKALELARVAYPNNEKLRVAYMLGINKGYEVCKEQMMKDAVDVDVELILHDKTGDIRLHTGYLPKELGVKYGDKVKIIIVKED